MVPSVPAEPEDHIEDFLPYSYFRRLPSIDGSRPDDPRAFPEIRRALRHPNGLLCRGGDLDPQRILLAYRHGIFPWYEEGIPILWWSPDPREVLLPEEFHLPRTLRGVLRRNPFEVRLDSAFREVMKACAAPRPGQHGTWITRDLLDGYCALHDQGWAHSAEAWDGEGLAGGLYGVAVGAVFFGESMFARRDNASKVAFAVLVDQLRRWGFRLIDCQVHTPHLERFGSRPMPRVEYLTRLEEWCAAPGREGRWQLDPPGDAARAKEGA